METTRVSPRRRGVLIPAIVTIASSAAAAAIAQSGVMETELGCDGQGLRCRRVSASFSFPDGPEGRLSLSFEEATRLTGSSFELTAELVDPRDPQLTSRLPRETFIPSDFPVLVRIEPESEGPLSFRRNWTLELVSENLKFSSHTPFRLFRAPTGGAFEDISVSLGSGSFRVRGFGGGFSEFVIAADLRPVERVAGRKLAAFENRLAEVGDAIPDVIDDLDQLVAETRQAIQDGALPLAIARLDSFVGLVRSRSGTEIPDESRPGEGEEAIAAKLLTAAGTLRHTLFLGLQSAQGGMSGFSRSMTADGKGLQLSLDFDGAFVVDPEDLEISAERVDAADTSLLARLPEGVHVPEEFPVLVRIDPKSGDEQAFSGRFEIELRTDSLRFLGGTPLRLFKAPDGGAFEDVTRTFGLGSFRVRGAGGAFSEFLIVEDMRPIETVVGKKFQSVSLILQDPTSEIPAVLLGDLAAALAAAQQNAEQGLLGTAITDLEAVVTTIQEQSGEGIPALWRSGDPAVNVAGELIAGLESLIFSLEIQEAPTSADPADVNRDGKVDVADVFFLINRIFGGTSPG